MNIKLVLSKSKERRTECHYFFCIPNNEDKIQTIFPLCPNKTINNKATRRRAFIYQHWHRLMQARHINCRDEFIKRRKHDVCAAPYLPAHVTNCRRLHAEAPFPLHALLLRFAAGHQLKLCKRGQEFSPRTLGGEDRTTSLPPPPPHP